MQINIVDDVSTTIHYLYSHVVHYQVVHRDCTSPDHMYTHVWHVVYHQITFTYMLSVIYINHIYSYICYTLPDHMYTQCHVWHAVHHQIRCTHVLYITRLHVHSCCTLPDYMYNHAVHHQITCTHMLYITR